MEPCIKIVQGYCVPFSFMKRVQVLTHPASFGILSEYYSAVAGNSEILCHGSIYEISGTRDTVKLMFRHFFRFRGSV